jgi:hypothetical protein
LEITVAHKVVVELQVLLELACQLVLVVGEFQQVDLQIVFQIALVVQEQVETFLIEMVDLADFI